MPPTAHTHRARGRNEEGWRRRLRQRPVREVMRRRYPELAPETSLKEAARLLEEAGLRRAPVLRDGILLGVVSRREIFELSLDRLSQAPARRREGLLEELRVELLLGGVLQTVEPDETLGAAARRMLRARVGFLPVVEAAPEGLRLVGILSEGDLLRVAYDSDSSWAESG